MSIKVMALFSILLVFSACRIKNPEAAASGVKAEEASEVPVTIMVINKGFFSRQLVSNGRLESPRKGELRFNTSGELSQIGVKNGQRVQPGGLLATIADHQARHALQQATVTLQRAELDFQEMLIGMGHNLDDTANIAFERLELAKVRSGFAIALTGYETAKRLVENCRLVAPFGGVIANISHKVHEHIGNEPFCLLIEDARFEVAFQVLESELTDISVGNLVTLSPFINEKTTYKGNISEINPLIDRNGLVRVKALVTNDGKLVEGMNMRVIVEKPIPDKYVVPRSAVLLRDNWEVLFKVVGGKAYWNYVQTTHENTASYAVIPHPEKKTASLADGDTIIIGGNLNLAHGSRITIQ